MVTGKSKRILFIGDLNVDILMGGLAQFPVPDREITCETFEITIGSAAAICACAHASLGGDAAFCGLAGSDQYGEYMIKGLQSFGINTDLIERSDAVATGVTVNLIESGRRTQVTYPGTIAAFDGHQLNSSIVGRFDHIHIAGPYQQTTFRPRITELLKPCRSQSVTTSLDPQWDQTERWEIRRRLASLAGLSLPQPGRSRLGERVERSERGMCRVGGTNRVSGSQGREGGLFHFSRSPGAPDTHQASAAGGHDRGGRLLQRRFPVFPSRTRR